MWPVKPVFPLTYSNIPAPRQLLVLSHALIQFCFFFVLFVRVRACARVCLCAFVCACMRERERRRESACACVCLCLRVFCHSDFYTWYQVEVKINLACSNSKDIIIISLMEIMYPVYMLAVGSRFTCFGTIGVRVLQKCKQNICHLLYSICLCIHIYI